MRIGVPTEIKDHEFRVGLTPAAVGAYRAHGHAVLVQRGAGAAIGLSDAQYEAAGATLLPDAAAVYAQAAMIVKVKEPQPDELPLLRDGQLLFAYLHLAADPQLAAALLERGVVGVAYETITDAAGRLPLLAPMSEVAGRMAVQAAATYLEKPHGGMGVLLGGVPGVPAAQLVIVGAGVVGMNAVQAAAGLGARVTVLDRDLDRLRALDLVFGNRVSTRHATAAAIHEAVVDADAVIGAVLVPGAAAPKLVTRATVAAMRPGSVVVDVAIDQGGCVETARATTHTAPTYVLDGVIHYCVTNMPSAVARTATLALNSATLAPGLALADRGWRDAMRADPHLCAGLNLAHGQLTHAAVAHALGRPYHAAEHLLG